MKPLFTIHEGEFLVGEHINRRLGKKYEVWVPTKDEGTDLLVTRRKGKHRPVRIQVKFSRGYGSGILPASQLLARSWFTLKPQKIRSSAADLWVFVTLTLKHDAHHVLVPTRELCKRIPRNAGKMWNLYLTVFRERRGKVKCYDMRGLPKKEEAVALYRGVEKERDYSKFVEDWQVLARLTK